MPHLKLSEILRLVEGQTEADANALSRVVTGYAFDTRRMHPGDLFFALKGQARDGHQFVNDAKSKGASGAIVSYRVEDVSPGFVQIVVPSPLSAFQKLAARVRTGLNIQVVAVTGSNGKTTTKEMLAHVLMTRYRINKSPGNFNNHIGVPFSILALEPHHEVLILEIASNHRGEVAHLASIAQPTLGVVTNIGRAHIGNFNSIEDIALEKVDLLRSLKPEGIGIVNADDTRLMEAVKGISCKLVGFGIQNQADFCASHIVTDSAGITHFKISDVDFELRTVGLHNVYNALAAIAVSHALGIGLGEAADAFATYEPVRMRKSTVGDFTVIDDTYNANPDSVRAALEAASRIEARRKVFIMGEMLELGDEAERLHTEVGRFLPEYGFKVIVGIGGLTGFACLAAREAGLEPDSIRFFSSKREAKQHLLEILKPGDLILIKGSRMTGLDEISGFIELAGAQGKI